MLPNLKLVWKRDSELKGRALRFLHMSWTPLQPLISVRYVNLDAISIYGHGFLSFRIGHVNAFRMHGPNLHSSNVTVTYTDNLATTVAVTDVSPGIVEVSYRVHDHERSWMNVRIRIGDSSRCMTIPKEILPFTVDSGDDVLLAHIQITLFRP